MAPLLCGLVLATVALIGLSNTGAVDGAEAIYIFGDSFVDLGNGGNMTAPYGMTWPGYPTGRASDGRNEADYFGAWGLTSSAELFGLPSPTPYWHLQSDAESMLGVNFGRGGGGITYAYGHTSLDAQVDQLQGLVQRGVLTDDHLRKSVALVSIGVNDYGSRNFGAAFQESSEARELESFVGTVVDGIALNVVRLHGFGIRNIIVANLALMACSPYATVESGYTACSSNGTLLNQTSIHNTLLRQRVRSLNEELRGVRIIIVDQTKAFDYLFRYGSGLGFENTLKPCCIGVDSHYCAETDSEGKPLYTVCEDAGKAVIFDTIHPTQAAWKAVINLYASGEGFTQESPKGSNLNSWIKKYNV